MIYRNGDLPPGTPEYDRPRTATAGAVLWLALVAVLALALRALLA